MAGEYPERPSHFAHRYCRLLVKTCAAQEIGHVAYILCVTIAHLEDAKRYTGPVSFFNEQLMALVAVKKWDSLDTARKRATEAGWLHYETGGRCRPGRYWVTLPQLVERLDDGSCDEETALPRGGELPQSSYPSGGDRGGELPQSSYPSGGDRGGYRHGEPFLPSPSPNTNTHSTHEAARSGVYGSTPHAEPLPQSFDTPAVRLSLGEWRDWLARHGKLPTDPGLMFAKACLFFDSPESLIRNIDYAIQNGYVTLTRYQGAEAQAMPRASPCGHAADVPRGVTDADFDYPEP